MAAPLRLAAPPRPASPGALPGWSVRVSPALPRVRPSVPVARALREGERVALDVESLGFGGVGVARDPDTGLTVLLDPGAMTLPGSTVMARVTQVKKNHARANVEQTLEESVHQVPCACAHFSAQTCGGCTAMGLSYDQQVAQKELQVAHMFRHVAAAAAERKVVWPMVGADARERYRNKSEFFFDAATGAVGMHPPRRPDVVTDLAGGCLLQSETADAALECLRTVFAAGTTMSRETREGLHSAAVRTGSDGEVMVNLSVTSASAVEAMRSELVPAFLDAFGPANTLVVATVEPREMPRKGARGRKVRERRVHEGQTVLHGGREWVTDTLCGLRFRVSASSFFQTNPAQATLLYEAAIAASLEACRALKSAGTPQGDSSYAVVDLFCGTGTLGLCVACAAASDGLDGVQVMGLEQSASAVVDARENAHSNGIVNARFLQCDLATADLATILQGWGPPDVVITDPPRGGMSAKCISDLRDLGPARIVYVSCNPSTQARDVAALCDPTESSRAQYALTRLQPFDLFPHTPHIETVAVLDRAERQ